MTVKKYIAIGVASVIAVSATVAIIVTRDTRPVLKVANWAEYIDGGDSDSEMIHEFEAWYKEQTGKEIRVEYCTASDNETLYTMMKMGDSFDIVCPSEYMIMKLAKEGYIQKLPLSFYDESVETNYYANYVSAYIKETFSSNYIDEAKTDSWEEYAAGYMWGTTGFVYNPELVDEEDVKSWNIFTNKKYAHKITAKNNIRDTYFVGLAMYYEDELLQLKEKYESGKIPLAVYQAQLTEIMNDTEESTMNAVKKELLSITDNLYGFETDEGKNDTIEGKIIVNYQWSGDAVYVMDYAEGADEENLVENPITLNYAIPESVSNLWFDGWALTKTCNNVEAATMFINFLSRPDNVVRNMEFIGYTSCIAGPKTEDDEYYNYIYENYVEAYYSAEDDDDTAVDYDLSYFFGDGYILSAPAEQLQRQLFAQYPSQETLAHCVAMRPFEGVANMRANMMWSDITFL